jgi:hypothetical protein
MAAYITMESPQDLVEALVTLPHIDNLTMADLGRFSEVTNRLFQTLNNILLNPQMLLPGVSLKLLLPTKASYRLLLCVARQCLRLCRTGESTVYTPLTPLSIRDCSLGWGLIFSRL